MATARGVPAFTRKEWPWLVVLCVVATLAWCAAYHRWSVAAWTTPLTYANDAWWGMASAKAVAQGDVWPLLSKHPASFGAPFTANWDDYPSVDEGILGWLGLLDRIFGVFAGANVAVLSAHLLAALAFYFVCRRLRYDRIFAIAGALVFAFSRYAFSRSLPHLGLTFYWHVPLGILVFWICVAKAPLRVTGRWAFCIAVAVLHGIQNPYYTGMFMQLLAWAAVVQLLRRLPMRRIVAPLLLLTVTASTFLLMNVDTFWSRIVNGPNPRSVERNYAGLEFYALKPVELFLPVVHQIGFLHNWARETYFAKTMLIGEAGSPYLGVVGIAALVWLTVSVLRVGAIGESARKIPSHFWLILWVLAYSVVGGVNGIVGFALELFRGTNRYSIVILALVLLFLVRQLTRLTRPIALLPRMVIAAVVVAVALFDQIPPALGRSIPQVAREVIADREIVRLVESKLPAGASVFQLPVADFPEAGPVENMSDYEHFRPFLHSHALRYSYGSVRGRAREAWQKETAAQPPPSMIAMLESYGFAAVWINRNGYRDRGAAVIDGLRGVGRSEVLAENATFFCVALHPSERPVLPPEFASGWHKLESGGGEDWRWTSGSAELVLHNEGRTTRSARVSFQVNSAQARHLQVISAGKTLAAMTLLKDAPAQAVEFAVALAPGRNVIRFETDVPGELPDNGDPRRLAFCVRNLKVLD